MFKAIFPSLYYLILLHELTRSVHSFVPDAKLMRCSFNSNRKHDCNSFQTILAASVSPSPQLLEFREPLTNVTVVLIGSMHYNPASINLVSRTIENLGQKDVLASVVIESCDLRWNKTLQLYDQAPFLESLLGNEMRAAQQNAFAFNLPVVLGDQQINITSAALKESLKGAVVDLATPPRGWRRFKDEVSRAWDEAVPTGDPQYLSPLAFLDPKLIIATPVSLVKYPLSFLVRDPVPTSIAFALLFGLSYFTYDADIVQSIMQDPNQNTLIDYAVNLLLAMLETLVFARLLLRPLLADRNVILAQNILQQCKLYMDETNDYQSSPRNAVYASGSSLGNMQTRNNGTDKVVVAVLGMAHLNGVMKILKEQKV